LKRKLDFEISQKLENKNCFTISAATHFGLENWTKHLVELLKNTIEYETVFENIKKSEYKKYKAKMIEDITEFEKPKLLEE
jgi:esterase/lipase